METRHTTYAAKATTYAFCRARPGQARLRLLGRSGHLRGGCSGQPAGAAFLRQIQKPMTYSERQYHPNRWLQGLCAGVALAQVVAMTGAETGLHWLPLGYAGHLGMLLAAALLLFVSTRSGLALRVGPAGLSVRYFPYQWRFRHVRWAEVRQLQMLAAGARPAGARYGLPERDFTRVYWLTRPQTAILNVVLVNDTRLFISTEHPDELLHFLQRELANQGKI